MIFVTTGSQKFQFNRLLIRIDELIEKKIITEEVFAQKGYSDYKPKHYESKKFITREEFAEVMKKSDIVITHGGTGAIIGAVKNGKKVIAVPRLAEYGEHVDDHQKQIVKQFDDMSLIKTCYDIDKLEEALSEVKTTIFLKYKSNTSTIINDLEEYLYGKN